MKKSASTRLKILNTAMEYVCQYGLVKVSIGELSKRLTMSRTGVITHFTNKEDMQIAILHHCEDVFIRQVIEPSRHTDPLSALTTFLTNWINWVYRLTGKKSMTCPFIKAIAEYQDNHECRVKATIREQQQRTLKFMQDCITACINNGQISKMSDVELLSQQFYGFYLNHNIQKHLLNDSLADARFLQQVKQTLATNSQE